jgi:hypothetical protein
MTEPPGTEARLDASGVSGAQVDMMIAKQNRSLWPATKQVKSPVDHLRVRLSLQFDFGTDDILKEWRQSETVDDNLCKRLRLVGDYGHRLATVHLEEGHDAWVDLGFISQVLGVNFHEPFAASRSEQPRRQGTLDQQADSIAYIGTNFVTGHVRQTELVS